MHSDLCVHRTPHYHSPPSLITLEFSTSGNNYFLFHVINLDSNSLKLWGHRTQVWRPKKDTIPAYTRSGDTFCATCLVLPNGSRKIRALVRMYWRPLAHLSYFHRLSCQNGKILRPGAELWGDSHQISCFIRYSYRATLDFPSTLSQEPSRPMSYIVSINAHVVVVVDVVSCTTQGFQMTVADGTCEQTLVKSSPERIDRTQGRPSRTQRARIAHACCMHAIGYQTLFPFGCGETYRYCGEESLP